MRVNVDWISISLPSKKVFSLSENGTLRLHDAHNVPRVKRLFAVISSASDVEQGKGRAPFRNSLHSPKGGWTYFDGADGDYSLIEFTGFGCSGLRVVDQQERVLMDWADRVTRIDIAADMECNTDPEVFAASRDSQRFKSGAVMFSDTGKTVYVGSRHSDRYARVYRYYEPHPRSKFLRCEMVLKDQPAKQAASMIAMDRLAECVAALGEVFKWTHPQWTPADFDDTFKLSSGRENHKGGTQRWLVTSVLSAIRKELKSGNREFVEYFAQQVYNLISDSQDKE